MNRETDWAWAAGLFEGEGFLRIENFENRKRYSLGLCTTDLDVLKKFHRVVGFGEIYFKKKYKSHYKQTWEWRAGKLEEIKIIGNKFLPFLGERRSSKINELISYNPPSRKKPFCRKGHKKVKQRKDGYYLCLECPREWQRNYAERKNA